MKRLIAIMMLTLLPIASVYSAETAEKQSSKSASGNAWDNMAPMPYSIDNKTLI